MLLKLMEYYLKNKILSNFLAVLLLAACQSTDKKTTEASAEKKYVMYEPSEMGGLMQDFYAYNEQLKAEILEGKDLTQMPEEFLDIHTATMTDPDGRNAIFKAYAPTYIKLQQAVHDTTSTIDVKTRYNNAINVCLACHQTECVGPIPRIKKLLIQ
jgi:hypothetical protein